MTPAATAPTDPFVEKAQQILENMYRLSREEQLEILARLYRDAQRGPNDEEKEAYEEKISRMREMIEKITEAPLTAGIFLEFEDVNLPIIGTVRKGWVSDGKAKALYSIDRQIVVKPLDGVIIASGSMVIGKIDRDETADSIASFDRWHIREKRLAIVSVDSKPFVAKVADAIDIDKLVDGVSVVMAGGYIAAVNDYGASEESTFFEVPSVTFDDIGGLDEIKDKFKEIVAMFKGDRTVMREYGFSPERGIIIQGVPGCGKTKIAKALANHINTTSDGKCFFRAIKPANIRNELYGRSERNIRDEFARANAYAKKHPQSVVVMFFDELDGIAGRRGQIGGHIDDRILNAFLAELDGVQERSPNVIVIGATNRADQLDPAIIRPGRFGDAILTVKRPDAPTVAKIVECFIGDKPLADDIATIQAAVNKVVFEDEPLFTVVSADRKKHSIRGSNLINGAILENACSRAKKKAVLRHIAANGNGNIGITAADVADDIKKELAELVGLITNENAHSHMPDLFDGPVRAVSAVGMEVNA